MSRIQFDYTNVLASAVGPQHGITDDELAKMEAPSSTALAAVLGRRKKDLRWLDLPYEAQVHDEILEYAASVRGRFKNVVVCGIGGSALGNIALHSALSSPYHNLRTPSGLPRLFVLDNIDPDLVGEWLHGFDPADTLFNVVSKSGGTAETMAQFLIFRAELVKELGEAGHRDHIVVTTDVDKGVLRDIVRREGYASFVVPDGVGGRFSVLSAVGLLSSALVGIDIKGLCAGAAAMDEVCQAPALRENPALMHAAIQFTMDRVKKKNVVVTMPYSHRLRDMADWYAQLLAESIGKRKGPKGEDVFVGPTPVRAVGVTDQHSQVQLYVEGPFDKWFTFLSVEKPDHKVIIPPGYPDLEGVSYLGQRSLVELFHAERDGTRIALTEAGRPNATLTIEKIDAHALGQLIFMLELSVGVMGEHYRIDAFDQPGVEAGKIAAYALMGRAGFEKRRAEIEKASSRVAKRIV